MSRACSPKPLSRPATMSLTDQGGGKRREGIGSLNKEAPDGCPPRLPATSLTLLPVAQHRGGTAARFEPIPVENGIKRGFSFSTGRAAASRS
jgi:hypothetical protein